MNTGLKPKYAVAARRIRDYKGNPIRPYEVYLSYDSYRGHEFAIVVEEAATTDSADTARWRFEHFKSFIEDLDAYDDFSIIEISYKTVVAIE